MRILTTLAAAGLFVSTAASAVTVTFGGQQGPTDLGFNGDQTPTMSTVTKFTTAGGALATSDFFGGPGINGLGGSPCSSASSLSANVNTLTDATTTGYYSDPVPLVRGKPVHGGTCFAVVNDVAGFDQNGNPIPNHSPGAISINQQGGVTPIYYAGFLWGTPDDYNYVKFLDVNGNPLSTLSITYNGAAFGSNGTITGADVFKQFGYTVNPGAAGEQFINFQFTQAENVGSIEIGNTGGCCFEFTNYAESTDPVIVPSGLTGKAASSPAAFALAVTEPGAAFALVAGLGMFGLARRKRA